MTDTQDQRTSLLGGEVARRGLPVAEPAFVAWVATAAALGLFTFIVVGATPWMLLVDIVVGGALFAATWPFSGRSWAGQVVHDRRTRRRGKAGEHLWFHPSDPRSGSDIDPYWTQPVPLGTAAPLDLAGTGLDELFVLEHRPPGDNSYFSVVLSLQGLADGLRDDARWASAATGFGRALSTMAKRGSHVRGAQWLHRSVGADLRRHIAWGMSKVAAMDTDATRVTSLIESYGDLLDEEIGPRSEEHRAYAVLIFPRTPELMAEARRAASARGAARVGGIGQVIATDTARIVDFLTTSAQMGRVEVLGEQRACGVIRSFVDPSFQLDAHRDARWATCWPSYLGGRDSVTVGTAGAWHTRVARIASGSIEPVPLTALWLSPLLTGVAPDPGDDDTPPSPTIRTISVRMDFVDAAAARGSAISDSTGDLSAQKRELDRGQITDGTSSTMATSSLRRRADLVPGSGHHGVIYAMSLSVTAPTEDDVLRASVRIERAAEEAAIKQLIWCTDRHDAALFETLPLGRGIAATQWTRVGGRFGRKAY